MRLTQMDAWQKLQQQTRSEERLSVNEQQLPSHQKTDSIFSDRIYLDYSCQRINKTILDTLLELADACALPNMITQLVTGGVVNTTEHRPALHTALRRMDTSPLMVDGVDVMPNVLKTREDMRRISEEIRMGVWKGFSHRPMTDIVNIGIGGSQLGPQFCVHAFGDSIDTPLRFHFISDMDSVAFQTVTKNLNPETTLFIVSSKSFTTPETRTNMQRALVWLNQPQHLSRHFIAVTAATEQARYTGMTQLLDIWDWVGGRFSLCSAINLITCIAIGYDRFRQLLEGAYEMDLHFVERTFSDNLPVMLGLLGIWNNNFLNIHQHCILSYSAQLEYLVPYIQQLDMESNGKSIDRQGRIVDYATGPIVWGGLGNQAQHSYYQLLCQGTHRITGDLISINCTENTVLNHLCDAHKTVLTIGSPVDAIVGQATLNHIKLANHSPKTIGALIALYEHKIFVQGVIWQINSFDQPGVESSKRILRQHVAQEVV